MPTLENRKHELFAQAVAKGMNATEAYSKAGYAPNPTGSNAARLIGDDRILARVAELQERAAGYAALTIEELITTGREIVTKAIAAEDYSAASMTVERIAKIGGLWVDRSEGAQTIRTVSAEPMTQDQWQEQHAAPSPPLN